MKPRRSIRDNAVVHANANPVRHAIEFHACDLAHSDAIALAQIERPPHDATAFLDHVIESRSVTALANVLLVAAAFLTGCGVRGSAWGSTLAVRLRAHSSILMRALGMPCDLMLVFAALALG